MDDRIGSLEPGKRADLITVSMSATRQTPMTTRYHTSSMSRVGGAGVVRFTVPAPAVPSGTTSRGLLTQAVKAIVVKVKDAVQ
jgi:cytosine/adenosine deaminase-related metal-dependent hydrolase